MAVRLEIAFGKSADPGSCIKPPMTSGTSSSGALPFRRLDDNVPNHEGASIQLALARWEQAELYLSGRSADRYAKSSRTTEASGP